MCHNRFLVLLCVTFPASFKGPGLIADYREFRYRVRIVHPADTRLVPSARGKTKGKESGLVHFLVLLYLLANYLGPRCLPLNSQP